MIHIFLLYGQGGQTVDTILAGDGIGLIQTHLKGAPNITVHDPKLIRYHDPKLKGAYNWDAGAGIAAIIRSLPKDDKVVLIGGSLGANELPAIAQLLVGVRDIELIIGIQPSLFGRKNKVPANVLRAVCIYNPIYFMTMGLGAYQWEISIANNKRTEMIYVRSYWPHPGDNNASVRNRVLSEVFSL